MATFDFGNIFKQAFGYDVPERKATVPQAPEAPVTSQLGSFYKLTDSFGIENFLPVSINGYVIPFAVVAVTTKKTIISTAMPERGGAVMEIVSLDNYVFNIKGILITDDNSFPEQGMQDIQDLFIQNQSVELRNVITDIFLNGAFDHKVVIREVKWPAVTGIEHAKPFEIDCESDMIFELVLD